LIFEGELLSGPVNTVSLEGDTVQLNCSSSLSPMTVMWKHVLPRTDTPTIFGPSLDRKGVIYEHYQGGRFEVRNQDVRFQNLIIRNVTLSDAGTYRCIDSEGLAYGEGLSSYGRWANANLTVIGGYL